MIKKLIDIFLSDALLLGCAVFMLFLFVCMLISPDNTIWVGEDNLIILIIEVGICVFAAVWATKRVISNLRRRRA